jgi:hypothetical protein
MPVAALIVVRPGIEVKAIESDSPRADPDRWQARADVAVESVFVHAEVAWGVAEAQKSGHGMRVRSGRGRGCGHRTGFGAHQRLISQSCGELGRVVGRRRRLLAVRG